MESEAFKKYKNINTQKLLADLYKNLTDGKINQDTYEIEREKIISGKYIQQSSDEDFEEETTSFTDRLLIIFWGFVIVASLFALFLLFVPLFPF